MATGKKFYWIKLRKDFMAGDIVDFLMSQRNGAQYVVLYQMLCMMCINTKGSLSRQIGELIVPFDTDKIQRDCKYFSRDTITIALELFKKVGLVYEQEEGGLVITGFDNLVGCETDYAIQKRQQRQLPDNTVEGIEDKNEDMVMDNRGDSVTDISMDCPKDSIRDNSVDNVHAEVHSVVPGQGADSSMDKNVDNVHTEIEKEIRVKSLEKDTEKDRVPVPVSDETVRQTDVRRVISAWNGLQGCGIKPISRVGSGSKRYKCLMARIREYSVDEVLCAVERIKGSDFLRGKNKNGWVITFDWFVLPNNFPKVLEGNYDNHSENGQRTVFDAWRDA